MPSPRPHTASASRSPRGPVSRPAFTLVELLVVVAIIVALAATSIPILSALLRDTRMNNAMARLRVGMQQSQALLADYQLADRNDTIPQIANAKFAGTGILVRWDDLKQDYEVCYLISDQNAASGFGPSDYLALQPDPSAPTAWRQGFSRFADLETMTLGTGIRVAGLRARSGTPSGLELLAYGGTKPCSSFAICTDVSGASLPPAQQIYVNLQDAPPSGGNGPWSIWSTTFYDDATATTGSHGAVYQPPTGNLNTGVGEGFLTSLPMVIVYQDADLPMDGNSPSGKAWRIPDDAGELRLNPAVDPNELLAQTKGRLIYLTVQGGTPMEF